MVLKVRSQEIDTAPELIATRDELQRFVRKNENDTNLESGWRHQLAGNELGKILSGAPLTVTVRDDSESPVSISL